MVAKDRHATESECSSTGTEFFDPKVRKDASHLENLRLEQIALH
jgi:hypothetical protein